MPERVSINGTIVAPRDAVISVFDRGFLYGDSVYETLRVYERVPLAFDPHLDRLYGSGGLVGFELPWTRTELREVIEATVDAAGLDDAYLRVIATRGSGPIGLDPGLARSPQLIVMVLELPDLPTAWYTQGRRAALVSIKRNVKQALDPQAKTGNYMNSVLALGEAKRRSADEAIMLDLEGRVAEASSANVFAYIDGIWRTPPLEVGILSGITRRMILAVCAANDVAAEERVLWPEDLYAATEIVLCSSVREILPIVLLDDRPVGEGTVGPATALLTDHYRREVRAQIQRARARAH